MAYICTKNIPCIQCGHFRPDPDRYGEKSCWAQLDEAAAAEKAKKND